ncbi:MAG: T9SS type A sorting domain-containing protein [Saprospiraceae bacterium]
MNNLYNLCLKPLSVAFILLIFSNSYSQAIKRQAISSYGAVGTLGNSTISQTAGQSYNTASLNQNNGISAGFQQPAQYIIEEVPIAKAKTWNISVFPNPASNSVTITSEEKLQEVQLSVTDITGKTILRSKIADLTNHSMDCSRWIAGNYIIQIQDRKGNQKTLKLIISK